MTEENIDDGFRPIGSVAQETKVRQRLFRAACFTLLFTELVGELDKQLPVAMALVLRQGEDASYIVVLR